MVKDFVGSSSLPSHLLFGIFFCRFVPESFRWLVTNRRYEEAETVIDKVAKMNGHAKPDISHMIEQAKLEEKQTTKHYSVIDLFKTRENVIKTLALLFIWFVMTLIFDLKHR